MKRIERKEVEKRVSASQHLIVIATRRHLTTRLGNFLNLLSRVSTTTTSKCSSFDWTLQVSPHSGLSHPMMAASSSFKITQLAIPAVSILITFLAYSSQYLFLYIEPEPLTTRQLIKFNTLLCCLWISYARACAVNPGHVPEGWRPRGAEKDGGNGMEARDNNAGDIGDYFSGGSRQRWCRRCEALKPPRAHHCKTCQRWVSTSLTTISLPSWRSIIPVWNLVLILRNEWNWRCIPKMDHHCPWTANCVSHFTFPHFIRFLLYAVTSMIYLEHFLYVRGSIVWKNRNIPSVSDPGFRLLLILYYAWAPYREFSEAKVESVLWPKPTATMPPFCPFHSELIHTFRAFDTPHTQPMDALRKHHNHRRVGDIPTPDARPKSQGFWRFSRRTRRHQDTNPETGVSIWHWVLEEYEGRHG